MHFVKRVIRWFQRLPFSRDGLLWLLIALGMLATGLLKGINLINLLACWLVTLILWNYWVARRNVRRVDARRQVPEYVFAQTPFRWTVELSNHTAKPANGIVVVDHGPAKQWFVQNLPRRGTTTLDGETSLPGRGVYSWPTIRLACGYPAGLANFERLLERPSELLVFPRLGNLQRGLFRYWLSQHGATQGSVRTSARRQPSAQLEFHGLRPFRPGDSPRHIHWRTTARRGEVMVREFEDLPNDNLILLVDPWTPTACEPGANSDFERLLSLAATIIWEWCRQKGDTLAVGVAASTPSLVQGTTGRELAVAALTPLARAVGEPVHHWPGLLALMEARELTSAATLVVSLREPPVDDLAPILRRPVASVNVTRGEEREFFEL